MCQSHTSTARLDVLGGLLAYPLAGTSPVLLARELSAHAAGSTDLLRFSEEAEGMSASTLEELYSRTFDLAPMAAPYLSVHLWGDESFQRSQLMTGLRAAYERVGADPGTELADHVSVVLTLGPRLSVEEWHDLAVYAVLPALRMMMDTLTPCQTPYRHLVAAAFAEVAASIGLDLDEARALPAPTGHASATPRSSCSLPMPPRAPTEVAHA